MNKIPLQLKEGEVFYKWCMSRIARNKNVISATTGSTGSGKSLNDLRKAEIHYENLFKEKFPIENCCFSIGELIKRIDKGNLRKGEILILEEAGVNSGSADWQNKIVKMFNYILQSFRSMNIILFMNLPVLSMLTKQARQLIHIHIETTGINFVTNQVTVKPLIHQLNQHTGKSYWKYLRIGHNKSMIKITNLCYNVPSKELRDAYEIKKSNFLKGITSDFIQEIDKKDTKKINERDRITIKNTLTGVQAQAHELFLKGIAPEEIAQTMGVHVSYVHALKRRIRDKLGWNIYNGIGNTPTLLI